MVISSTEAVSFGQQLADDQVPLAKRMRTLWKLRDDGSEECVAAISSGLKTDSALLRHELCYVLGQVGKESALPVLEKTLESDPDCMVRHEAAEAMGAIGCKRSIEILEKYSEDDAPEVSETCKVALDRFAWMEKRQKGSNDSEGNLLCNEEFSSVDPAPSDTADRTDLSILRQILLDCNLSTFERYRALFSLRNINSPEAASIVAEALPKACGSDLFRHEVAFVLGQMEQPCTAHALSQILLDKSDHTMVRHEAAEALGGIGGDVDALLEQFKGDENRAVRESCIVALDMAKYWRDFKNGNAGELPPEEA